MEEINDRYNRQELIKGWDQDKLRNARVAVIGSDNLADYTLLSLSSLGIGKLEIYSSDKTTDKNEFLLSESHIGESKAKSLENVLSTINPTIKIKGVSLSTESSQMLPVIGKPDLIIDLTNSPTSKKNIIEYAKTKGIKVISGSSDLYNSQVSIVENGNEIKEAMLKDFEAKEQGVIISGIMGGLICEEARKILMPLDENDVPIKDLEYSVLSADRFSLNGKKTPNRNDLKDKKIVIIGAGALSNFATTAAALEGIGSIDIIDYDTVESTNLNRQFWYYDSVGRLKAEALAEKIRKIAPNIKVRAITQKLDENSNYFKENKTDAIVDCVDSFAVRAIINYHGVHNNIPIVSGGTNSRSGQVTVYIPGKSACLDCRLKVEEALAEQRKASSCKYAPDPSVVMTNQVIGNMMIGELIKVLDPNLGEPINRILKYDSTIESRGGFIGANGSCNCKKGTPQEWLAEVDKKYKPKELIKD